MSCVRFDEADALHARARAFVTAFERGTPMPESFDALACAIVRHQARRHAGYARLCADRNVDPTHILRAGEAPAVPTDAFKVARIATFPKSETRAIFRTSGTTLGTRGAHELRTTSTYDLGARAFGRWALMAGLDAPPRAIVLGPSPAEAPDSSLTHMIALFVRDFAVGARDDETFFLRDGALAVDDLARCIAALDRPALVLATSFALVHLSDALAGRSLALPAGSRVMQTGGFKGRSREVDAAELAAEVARMFDVPETSIVSEYGMTELSSQFYEATLRGGARGVLVEPPWARVIPVDPETLAPVADGEVGIARIEDLHNVESALAVQTADRVRRVQGGFELLGRSAGSPPRGCSIGIDELLEKA